MSLEKEDKLVRELMEKSAAEMPFVDFEEKLMVQIHHAADTSGSFLKNVKLSWFFFVIGTIFGLSLSFVSGEIKVMVLGIPIQNMILIAQAIIVIFLISQFDSLIELVRKREQ